MYSILILLAIWLACYSERLNFTVALMPLSAGFSGTYPDSTIFCSTVAAYFFNSSRKMLLRLMYSSSSLLAFVLRVSTGSMSSIFSFSPALKRVSTPLRASFGSLFDFTAPIRSGKSKLFSFFTSLMHWYLFG